LRAALARCEPRKKGDDEMAPWPRRRKLLFIEAQLSGVIAWAVDFNLEAVDLHHCSGRNPIRSSPLDPGFEMRCTVLPAVPSHWGGEETLIARFWAK